MLLIWTVIKENNVLNKSKLWYSGLSSAGKALVIASAAVLSVAAINVAASPDSSKQPKEIAAQSSTEEKKTETKAEPVPFTKTTVEDSGLEKGKTALRVAGVNGEKVLTYEVMYKEGKETARKLVKEDITRPPVTEVTAVGTYVAPPPPRVQPSVTTVGNCDPNYSGCVPIASDVDCAGGSGNGPAYARGPVTVTGSDIYDLDRDGDGSACE